MKTLTDDYTLLQQNKNHSATTIASPTTANQLRPHSTNNNTTTTNVLVPPNQREEKEEEEQQQPPIWVTITDMDDFRSCRLGGVSLYPGTLEQFTFRSPCHLYSYLSRCQTTDRLALSRTRLSRGFYVVPYPSSRVVA
jgi:hypothetical protein